MPGENVVLIVFAVLPVAIAAVLWWFFRRLRRRNDGARPTRSQLVTGNALVLVFLLTLGVLAGECYFRFIFDSTDTFGLLRTSDRWFERHYHRNADGFRDDVEYQLGAVPAGRRRVTFVGDSFTAGHGVRDVADRFANRVRAAQPDWEVHVFARNGWDTGAQADFLADRLPSYTRGQYETDLVVLVYCLNDIVDVLPEVGEIGRRLEAARDKGSLARSSYLFDTLRFLWIRHTNDDIGDYFPRLSAAYEGEAWRAQQKRLGRIRGAVTSQRGRLAVATFPMMHRLGDDYPFLAAHETLDAFWTGLDVPHLDLRESFAGRPASDLIVGTFDAHPNEEAHALAADALVPFVERALAR